MIDRLKITWYKDYRPFKSSDFLSKGGFFVQTALDKVSSKAGSKPSDLHQNSYRHLDSRSHLNLLILEYICTNLNANQTFKLSFRWDLSKALWTKPNPLVVIDHDNCNNNNKEMENKKISIF